MNGKNKQFPRPFGAFWLNAWNQKRPTRDYLWANNFTTKRSSTFNGDNFWRILRNRHAGGRRRASSWPLFRAGAEVALRVARTSWPTNRNGNRYINRRQQPQKITRNTWHLLGGSWLLVGTLPCFLFLASMPSGPIQWEKMVEARKKLF